MLTEVLKAKIHRLTVTGADIDYEGSITIDEDLLAAAGLHAYEKVYVADVTNGARFETYIMKGQRGSGVICLNGAAARLVSVADIIIVYGVLPYRTDRNPSFSTTDYSCRPGE